MSGLFSGVPRLPTEEEVARAVAAHPWKDFPALRGCTNHVFTGVLVPLVWGLDPQVLATIRPWHLRRHAGEVCFPGGLKDEMDVDLQATALREAEEELGITDARVLGRLSSIPLNTSDYRLLPFVAMVPHKPLRPNPNEVAGVLRFEIRELLSRPEIHAIRFQIEDRIELSPVFETGTSRPLFGGTAHVLHELLQVLAPLFSIPVPPLVQGRYTWDDVLKVKPGPWTA